MDCPIGPHTKYTHENFWFGLYVNPRHANAMLTCSSIEHYRLFDFPIYVVYSELRVIRGPGTSPIAVALRRAKMASLSAPRSATVVNPAISVRFA